TWPSSRVLAGWWPPLDRLRPRSLWLYHLLLHRIEAPVVVTPPAPQDHLVRLLLDFLAVSSPSDNSATTGRLAARLHLDPQLVGRFLVDLQKLGLVQFARGEQSWILSPEGKQVLSGEMSLRPLHERRTFYFAEPLTPGAPA